MDEPPSDRQQCHMAWTTKPALGAHFHTQILKQTHNLQTAPCKSQGAGKERACHTHNTHHRPSPPSFWTFCVFFCFAKRFGRLGGFCLGGVAMESWGISATWLHHKRYTRSLSHNSIPLAPTVWISQLSYFVSKRTGEGKEKVLIAPRLFTV